jgi:hypothetical protein
MTQATVKLSNSISAATTVTKGQEGWISQMLKTKLKTLMTTRKMRQHVVSEKNSREFKQPSEKKV